MVHYRFDIEQRTPEWSDIKLGKVGGSTAGQIIDARSGKLKTGKSVFSLAYKLIAEKQTHFAQGSDFVSDAMQWGIENEDEVIEVRSDDRYKPCGLIYNDELPNFVFSPDIGFYVNDEMIEMEEVKCSNSDTHIRRIHQNKVPTEYLVQCMTGFAICPTLHTVRFVNYDPRFDHDQDHYFVKELKRVDHKGFIENYRNAIVEFNGIVSDIEKCLPSSPKG